MQEYDVSINYELCTMCEDCIDACEEGVFELDSDGQIVVANADSCTGCKICVDSCIVSAIYVGETLDKMNMEMEKRKELRQKRKFIFCEIY